MSKERKRASPRPIIKATPRVRPQVDEPKKKDIKPISKKNIKDEPKKDDLIKIEEEVKIEIIKEPKKTKPKNDDKYVRYSSKDYNKFKLEISEKVIKNEMKFAYFAIDGDDFYHYYLLTKK